MAFFDQPFKELKDRIDKIDCAAKHQTAVNTLQVSQRCGQVHAKPSSPRMPGLCMDREGGGSPTIMFVSHIVRDGYVCC